MPSSYTTEVPVELQYAGENLNIWGDKLNASATRLTKAIAGYLSIALTGNLTLSTSQTSTDTADFQAYHASLKFTGTGPYTVTVPGRAKLYFIWNACSAALTLTTGAGSTVVVDAGAKVMVLCDSVNVGELGYAGYGLKAYIDSAVLAATGSLPAVTGNAGKFLYCDGVIWTPHTQVIADISDYASDQASKIATATGLAVALAIVL